MGLLVDKYSRFDLCWVYLTGEAHFVGEEWGWGRVGSFWVVTVLKPQPEIRNCQEASSAECINIRVFSDDALNVLPKIQKPTESRSQIWS